MNNFPLYISATFIATVLLAAVLFYAAANYSKKFLAIMIVWILIQSVAAITGFYNKLSTMTSRFPLLIALPLLLIIFTLLTKKGQSFINTLDIKTLTIFHIIRIPVELVLFWLFVQKAVPAAMTFEGRNIDIFSGLTAPLVYYFGFVKRVWSKPVIIVWNILCLLLLINVVANAVLSLPARYQQFGFENPNIALGYFPFILLPALLVPMALFANLAAIVQLSLRRQTTL